MLQPRVEAEIAFVLGDDLDAEGLTTMDLINAIDYLLPAIEVVDSRISDWDITIAVTIADRCPKARHRRVERGRVTQYRV